MGFRVLGSRRTGDMVNGFGNGTCFDVWVLGWRGLCVLWFDVAVNLKPWGVKGWLKATNAFGSSRRQSRCSVHRNHRHSALVSSRNEVLFNEVSAQ